MTNQILISKDKVDQISYPNFKPQNPKFPDTILRPHLWCLEWSHNYYYTFIKLQYWSVKVYQNPMASINKTKHKNKNKV